MIIQVYDQFLTVDECNCLIDFYKNNKDQSFKFGREGLCPRWPLQIPENTTEFKLLQNKLNEKGIYVNNSVIEYVQIVRWPIGSKQNPHYDITRDHTTLASIIYLNGGPKNQTTNEYLIPFVTGATLCSISEGNIIIIPVLLNSGVSISHFFATPGITGSFNRDSLLVS